MALIEILEKETPRLKDWNLIPSMVSRKNNGKHSSQQTVMMTLESSKANTSNNHDIFLSNVISRPTKFQHRRWVIEDMEGNTRGFLLQPKDGYYLLEKTDLDGRLVEVLKIHYKFHGLFRLLTDKPTRKAEVTIVGGTNLVSKEPIGKNGKCRVLNTAGRGRVASSKNMQLLTEDDGKIILQFVKWGDNQFHLDYKEPLDAFLAFGFALAQLDLGMITLV